MRRTTRIRFSEAYDEWQVVDSVSGEILSTAQSIGEARLKQREFTQEPSFWERVQAFMCGTLQR